MVSGDSMADDADVFRKLEQVSLGGAVNLLRALHELGRGETRPKAHASRDADGTRDVVYDVARFVLNGYEAWLRLQDRYYDVVTSGYRDLGGAFASAGCEVARERLRLEGRVGDVARGRFNVENEQQADAELGFRFG